MSKIPFKIFQNQLSLLTSPEGLEIKGKKKSRFRQDLILFY